MKHLITAIATVALLAGTLSARAQNQPPTVAANDVMYVDKNTPFTLTYEALKAISGAYDADSDVIYFQISSVLGGTLTLDDNLVSSGSTLVGPGDALVWTPPTNAFNVWVAAFEVRAYDLNSFSGTTTIGASIRGNTPPALTFVDTFSAARFQNAKMNTPYSLTFEQLRSASDLRDMDDDPVSFIIVSINSGTLTLDGNTVVAGQTFAASNTLVWLPPANVIAAGVNAFSVVAFDGKETSATRVAVKIDVTDPTPRFLRGPDQTITRHDGDRTVWDWAKNITPQDSALQFEVSNDNPSLFMSQPQVTAEGALIFSPEGVASGIANVKVVLVDDAGRRSAPQYFKITVQRGNVAPNFSLTTDTVTAQYVKLATVIPGVVNNISAGAPDETDLVTFEVTPAVPTFFAGRPAISTNGTLTFKLAAGVVGSTAVSIIAKDGKARSAPQTLSIEVPANPFVARAGNYNGLFSESDAVRHHSSGLLTMRLKDTGACSGKIMVEGGTYSFSGVFNFSQQMKTTVLRLGKSPLAVSLQLGDDEISGTISSDGWTAALIADRAIYNFQNPTPRTGKYTMVLPKGAAGPVGNSVAVLTVNADGAVIVSGNLADGSRMNQSTRLSKRGQWPLYVSLYAGQGSALGWITLSNAVGGDVSWVKTANTLTGYSPAFTNALEAIGSTFVPATNAPALTVTKGVVELNSDSQTFEVAVAGNGNSFSGNGLTLSINPKTGLVTGNFPNPLTKVARPIFGVVLQNEKNVSGFFLGPQDQGELAGFVK